MNRITALIVAVLITVNGFTQKTYFYTAIDGFAPAAKIGIEYRFTERWSLTASAGTCLVGVELISYNVFTSYRFSNIEKPFFFTINFGLLDNYIVYNKNDYSFNFGLDPGIGYSFKNTSRLTVRLGWIVGLNNYEGKSGVLSIPNYAIAYSFPLCKKNH